jgi:hypothetical protein
MTYHRGVRYHRLLHRLRNRLYFRHRLHVYTSRGILPLFRHFMETAERTDMPQRGCPNRCMRSYLVCTGLHHMHATNTSDLEFED